MIEGRSNVWIVDLRFDPTVVRDGDVLGAVVSGFVLVDRFAETVEFAVVARGDFDLLESRLSSAVRAVVEALAGAAEFGDAATDRGALD